MWFFCKQILFTFSLVLTCSVEIQSHHLKYEGNIEDPILFYVYTRQNKEVPQRLKPDVESVIRNVLNPTKPTTLAIHDIFGNKNAEEYEILKNSKLQVEDGNMIIVDYSSLVDDDKNFEAIFSYNQLISEAITDLFKMLYSIFNMNSKNIHLVGFGLGAHIAGLVGQNVYQQCGGKIKRITALDPTGVLFTETTPDSDRLTADDADFVEVVHTNAGEYGFLETCGHVDYYPNEGKLQPGCNATNSMCSHNRAYELVPEMWSPVVNQELILLKCFNIESMNIDNCRWINAKMGDLEQQSYGVFYVQTNSNKPYGKGAFKWQFL